MSKPHFDKAQCKIVFQAIKILFNIYFLCASLYLLCELSVTTFLFHREHREDTENIEFLRIGINFITKKRQGNDSPPFFKLSADGQH